MHVVSPWTLLPGWLHASPQMTATMRLITFYSPDMLGKYRNLCQFNIHHHLLSHCFALELLTASTEKP